MIEMRETTPRCELHLLFYNVLVACTLAFVKNTHFVEIFDCITFQNT